MRDSRDPARFAFLLQIERNSPRPPPPSTTTHTLALGRTRDRRGSPPIRVSSFLALFSRWKLDHRGRKPAASFNPALWNFDRARRIKIRPFFLFCFGSRSEDTIGETDLEEHRYPWESSRQTRGVPGGGTRWEVGNTQEDITTDSIVRRAFRWFVLFVRLYFSEIKSGNSIRRGERR